MVKPLGFSIDDKHVKRAGLDYWDELDMSVYENIDQFFEKNKGASFYFFTTKGSKNYSDAHYKDGDFLVFGRETKGLGRKPAKRQLRQGSEDTYEKRCSFTESFKLRSDSGI